MFFLQIVDEAKDRADTRNMHCKNISLKVPLEGSKNQILFYPLITNIHKNALAGLCNLSSDKD